MSELPPQSNRVYGRRKGRALRPHQKNLVETFLPTLQISVPKEGQQINLATLFPKPPQQIWLEIGFGNGEHLAQTAAQNPEVGFIGCEVFVNGIAALLQKIYNPPLENIRLHGEDIRGLLKYLPNESLDRIYILFPDPWPKKRHHKRRLINQAFLLDLRKSLKQGGLLRVATDDQPYFEAILEVFQNNPAFEGPIEKPEDWATPPEGWVSTRYEARGKRLQNVPRYITFKAV